MPQVVATNELVMKYAQAVHLTTREQYINVSHPISYEFGTRNGLDVLASIDQSVDVPTIFDIGAGNGSFLEAAKQHYARQGKDARTIGLVAFTTRNLIDLESEIIEGDFMRPETWRPLPSVPEDASLDLAVANLAFMHFADPLHGVRIALQKLKPGASLYISELSLSLDPESATQTIDALQEEIAAHSGDYEPDMLTQPDYVEFENVHLKKTTDSPFEQFDAIGAIKATHRAIYAVSQTVSNLYYISNHSMGIK